MSVWNYIGARSSTNQDGELYSEVADLYHKFRPRYPKALLDAATSTLPTNARILEIGCGPGTATLPLLERGFQVTCIEPGSGMIEKAKTVCQEYVDSSTHRVTFHHATLQEFLEQNQEKGGCCYDAIVAATSFHWAIDKEGKIVKMCHDVLKPNGKLVLLWNFPPEPNEIVRDAVANATNNMIPFYFSSKSAGQHEEDLCENILKPVESSGLFSQFSMEEFPTETTMPIADFTSMVRTFSHYIRMSQEEQDSFLATAEKTMAEKSGSSMDVTGLSLLNVATKVDLAE